MPTRQELLDDYLDKPGLFHKKLTRRDRGDDYRLAELLISEPERFDEVVRRQAGDAAPSEYMDSLDPAMRNQRGSVRMAGSMLGALDDDPLVAVLKEEDLANTPKEEQSWDNFKEYATTQIMSSELTKRMSEQDELDEYNEGLSSRNRSRRQRGRRGR